MKGGHLSDFRLDAIAAGRGTPEQTEHLAHCSVCQARWELIEQTDAYLRIKTRFNTVKEYARRDGDESVRRRRMRWYVMAPVAAAAMAVLIIAPPYLHRRRSGRHESERLARASSAPSMQVVRVSGPGELRPGDRVVIELTPAGAKRALAMGIDEAGNVSQIWPANGTTSGLLPSGKRVTLTPGSWAPWKSTRVEVFLSSEPLSAGDVRAAVAQARAASPTTAVRALRIDDLPDQSGRLSTFLQVESARGAGQPLGAPR